MALQHLGSDVTGEDVEDLRAWLSRLEGCPAVTEQVVLGCDRHGDERPTWMYVEPDASAGVARRRCLACAAVVPLLDSEARWTSPPMWACAGCGQSIVELAAGLSVPDGEHVEWVALAGRCVECGRLAGLTDVVVDRLPLSQVLPTL
ncbi:MAG: hypothetical protein LC789_17920 [Actinobacteria bacterium]|nr:hypothetical protein [Actinomycetota bacterium]